MHFATRRGPAMDWAYVVRCNGHRYKWIHHMNAVRKRIAEFTTKEVGSATLSPWKLSYGLYGKFASGMTVRFPQPTFPVVRSGFFSRCPASCHLCGRLRTLPSCSGSYHRREYRGGVGRRVAAGVGGLDSGWLRSRDTRSHPRTHQREMDGRIPDDVLLCGAGAHDTEM